MTQTPNTMHAAAIDHFGGLETISLRTPGPFPRSERDEILIPESGVGRRWSVGYIRA